MPVRPKQKRPYSDIDIKNSKLLDEHQKKLLLNPLPTSNNNLPDWKKVLTTAVDDLKEWEAVLEPKNYALESFRIPNGALLKRASSQRPLEPPGSVTAFTRWVHELYTQESLPQSIALGRAVDRELATALLTPNASGRWKLIYNGMGDKRENFYAIPSLEVSGRPLKAAPDLVFKESHTGRILIIEVKTTELAIPAGGWPDVRAQLWAYAQIPDFKRAPEILLRAAFYGVNPTLIRRCVVGWTFTKSAFDDLSERLFFYYKLHHDGVPKRQSKRCSE